MSILLLRTMSGFTFRPLQKEPWFLIVMQIGYFVHGIQERINVQLKNKKIST